jgi:hypothetical protein
MKVLNSNIDKDIDIGFEGWDYYIPANKAVLIDDRFAKFIEERLPFVMVVEPPKGKVEVPKIKKKKTAVYIQPSGKITQPNTQDMVAGVHRNPQDMVENIDGTPTSGTVDRDGIEWTGEGIEVDDLK